MTITLQKVPIPGLRSGLRGAARRLLCAPLLGRPVCWSGPEGASGVALTFDDGPHPVHTAPILDALRAHNAHATFFVVGRHVRKHPELVRRMVDEGHTVGSHTDTHADLAALGLAAARRECAESRKSIEQVTGRPVRFLRPPWGKMAPSTIAAARMSGLELVLWSIDSLDSRHLTPQELVGRLRENPPCAGDILLYHDDGANTVKALPAILGALTEQGLACVTLDDLLRR